MQRGRFLLFTRCQQPPLSVGRPRALLSLSRRDSPALCRSPAPESACFLPRGFTERQRPRISPVCSVGSVASGVPPLPQGQNGFRYPQRSVPPASPPPRALSCLCSFLRVCTRELCLPRGLSLLEPVCRLRRACRVALLRRWRRRPLAHPCLRGACLSAPSGHRERGRCEHAQAGFPGGACLHLQVLAWGGVAGPHAGRVSCFDRCRLFPQRPFRRHPDSCT